MPPSVVAGCWLSGRQEAGLTQRDRDGAAATAAAAPVPPSPSPSLPEPDRCTKVRGSRARSPAVRVYGGESRPDVDAGDVAGAQRMPVCLPAWVRAGPLSPAPICASLPAWCGGIDPHQAVAPLREFNERPCRASTSQRRGSAELHWCCGEMAAPCPLRRRPRTRSSSPEPAVCAHRVRTAGGRRRPAAALSEPQDGE